MEKMKFLLLGVVVLFTSVLISGPSLAILPEEPSGCGGYSAAPDPGSGSYTVLALYNNTEACADANKDLVCNSTETFTMQEGWENTTSSQFVFSDKPIVVTGRTTWNSGCTCSSSTGIWGYGFGYAIPSTQQLGTEYYLPSGDITITATQYNTDVTLQNSTGTYSYSLSAAAGELDITAEAGTRINSSKPIMVTGRTTWDSGCTCINYGIWGYGFGYAVPSTQQLGKEYYLPSGDFTITATQNDTYIDVDQNRDGIIDNTYSLNRTEEQTLSGVTGGTRINSSKPIMVTGGTTWNTGCSYCTNNIGIWGYALGYAVPSIQQLGTEYYLPSGDITITATQYNTDITLQNSTGTYSYSLSAPAGELDITAEAGTRINSSKPIMVTGRTTWNSGCTCSSSTGIWGYGSGYSLKPESPSTIVETEPKMSGLNEVVNVSGRLFNPASETLHNMTIKFNLSQDFDLTGPAGKVTLTIYKKFASNDTILSQTEVNKTYQATGTKNRFNATYSDTTILDDLKPDRYIEVVAEVSPTAEGYYNPEVNSEWEATHYAW